MTIVAAVLEVGLAYIMLNCVDFATSGNLKYAGEYGTYLIIYLIIYFAIDFISKKLKWDIIRKTQIQLRKDVINRIFSMPLEKFHKKTLLVTFRI